MSVRSTIDNSETWEGNKKPTTNKDYNYFTSPEFRKNYDQLQRSMRCCSFVDINYSKYWKNRKKEIEECNDTGKSEKSDRNLLENCKSCFPASCYVRSDGKCIL